MFSLSADSMILVGISLLIGAAASLLVYMSWRLYRDAPPTERQYMDPLPRKVKLVWPMITAISPWFERMLNVEAAENIRTGLRRSGLGYLYSPYEFAAMRVVAAIVAFIFVAVGLYVAHVHNQLPWLILALLVGYWMPRLSMFEQTKKRMNEIVRSLPIYIDFITMSVEAGLSLGGALAQAVSKGPPGLLRMEFERVNRDVKAGAARIEALQAMSERLEIREVTTLINAIAMAERTGASIGQALRQQADQRLSERFQRAEKLAMEAPVKLIFPLVAFIFPCTFVMIGFPLIIEYLRSTGHV